jgi:large subunit ribosomal protein L29
MKAADLREKSVEDLRELQKTLAHDVFQNRLKNFTNRLDDTSQIRKLRRDLARVKTLLSELQRKAQEPASRTETANIPPAEKVPARKRAGKTAKTEQGEAIK